MKLDNLTTQIAYSQEKFQSAILHTKDGVKCILFAFAAGQELKTHTAPHDVLLVILEGSCRFTIQDSEQTLTAGEIIKIPGTVPHSLHAETDFKMVLVK